MSDAREITLALRGRWNAAANRGTARCPVHDDHDPSLSIRDGDEPGRVLFTCFAGCDRRNIVDALRRRGLVDETTSLRNDITARKPSLPVEHVPDPAALEIWLAASQAAGSIVERYLRHRGITLVPPSLRCGSRLHLDRYTMPAMVAAAQRPDGKIVAVQTTLLTTAGKKATVSTPRITTGALGAGAIRLAKAGDVLGLAEGVETALSAMQLTGVPTWACLGASRMHRVAVPDSVRELHIFGDNDDAGSAAAERTAHAHRHRRVVLRFPPEGCKDWNDYLAQAGRAAA